MIHAGVVSAEAIMTGHYGAPSSLAPFVAPSWPYAETSELFRRAWVLASDEAAVLLCAAEKVPGDLGGLELGSLRSFSVAEALLCTELGGPLFAARVLAAWP